MKAADKLFPSNNLDFMAPGAERYQQTFSFKTLVREVWQNIIRYLSTRNELQVWQKRDRSGEIHWCAYDPVTGNRASLSSEDELRSWIESQYYQCR